MTNVLQTRTGAPVTTVRPVWGPRTRRALVFTAVAALFLLISRPLVGATGGAAAPVVTESAVTAAVAQEAAALSPENASEVSRQSVHEEPLWAVLARLVNFAILVGVLVYFLRAPVAGYLARRSTEIRGDLTRAAETREAATAQLAEIEQKMKALPADIDALKARGAEEIAAEQVRLRQATAAERERLLEQARREIDLAWRAAERDLVKRAADLTIGLASDRIKRVITDDDRSRLVDRYLAQMQKDRT